MKLKAVLICSVVLLALSACGTQRPHTSRASTGDGGNYSSSPTWLDVGNQITAARQADDDMDTAVPPLLSAPVDVTTAGTYDIIAGPVDSNVTRHDIAFTLPPDVKSHFVVTGNALANVRLIQRDGATYIDLPLTVDSVSSEYDGLTVWFQ